MSWYEYVNLGRYPPTVSRSNEMLINHRYGMMIKDLPGLNKEATRSVDALMINAVIGNISEVLQIDNKSKKILGRKEDYKRGSV